MYRYYYGSSTTGSRMGEQLPVLVTATSTGYRHVSQKTGNFKRLRKLKMSFEVFYESEN
jgi:hypothetical protein